MQQSTGRVGQAAFVMLADLKDPSTFQGKLMQNSIVTVVTWYI